MKTNIDQRYFETRLGESGGQVLKVVRSGSHWTVTTTFPGEISSCPRCGARKSKPYGWRAIMFRDVPASDGRHVKIVANRPRNKCLECNAIFITDISCLIKKTRITRAFETYLREKILEVFSIRKLARLTDLSAKTIYNVLIDSIPQRNTAIESIEKIAIRSFKVGLESYFVIFDLATNETIHFLARPKADLSSLLQLLNQVRANSIDLPADAVLANAIHQHIPESRLTVSEGSLVDLCLEYLFEMIEGIAYKLRREGLTKLEALHISQHRVCDLNKHFKEGENSKFWAGYHLKEKFVELLMGHQISYRDAIQQTMEQSLEICRPHFFPMYRALNRLNELGVDLSTDPKIESLDAKLKLFRNRLGKPGAHLEFPTLGALIFSFFACGFGRLSLWDALKETIFVLRDLYIAPHSFLLSETEEAAILFASARMTNAKALMSSRKVGESNKYLPKNEKTLVYFPWATGKSSPLTNQNVDQKCMTLSSNVRNVPLP